MNIALPIEKMLTSTFSLIDEVLKAIERAFFMQKTTEVSSQKVKKLQ